MGPAGYTGTRSRQASRARGRGGVARCHHRGSAWLAPRRRGRVCQPGPRPARRRDPRARRRRRRGGARDRGQSPPRGRGRGGAGPAAERTRLREPRDRGRTPPALPGRLQRDRDAPPAGGLGHRRERGRAGASGRGAPRRVEWRGERRCRRGARLAGPASRRRRRPRRQPDPARGRAARRAGRAPRCQRGGRRSGRPASGPGRAHQGRVDARPDEGRARRHGAHQPTPGPVLAAGLPRDPVERRGRRDRRRRRVPRRAGGHGH